MQHVTLRFDLWKLKNEKTLINLNKSEGNIMLENKTEVVYIWRRNCHNRTRKIGNITQTWRDRNFVMKKGVMKPVQFLFQHDFHEQLTMGINIG